MAFDPSKNSRRLQQTTGSLIMKVSEAIYPVLLKALTGCRDQENMALQPARVRGIALNMAQEWVKHNQSKY